MKKVLVATLFALLTLGAYAQQPVPEKAPVLTEMQQLKLENIKLKYQQYATIIANAQQEQVKLQAQYEEINKELTKEHPGYVLANDGTLQKAPPPAPASTDKK